MKITTIQIPTDLRDRLAKLKTHPRQPYAEVIGLAIDRLGAGPVLDASAGEDPLIKRHRKALRALARQHGLRVSAFGSRARGEARPDSDLDILYVLDKERTLFDVVAFKQDAEELVGVAVDMLSASISRPGLRARVEKDAVVL